MELLDEDRFSADKHHRTLEQLQEEGYETDMYRYIREGFELFKKNPGLMILYTLIFAGIMWALSNLKFGGVVELLVSPCLVAGWYLASRRLAHDKSLELGHFFEGFKIWPKLVGYRLVSDLFIIFGLILLVLPGIYLAVSYILVIPIILFYPRDLELMEVLEGSRKVITRKWWNFLGLIGLLILVNIAGVLCLVVGLLISLPVTMCTFYVLYDDLVGVSLEDDRWDTSA